MKSQLNIEDNDLFSKRLCEKESQRRADYHAKLADPNTTSLKRKKRKIILCAFSPDKS